MTGGGDVLGHSERSKRREKLLIEVAEFEKGGNFDEKTKSAIHDASILLRDAVVSAFQYDEDEAIEALSDAVEAMKGADQRALEVFQAIVEKIELLGQIDKRDYHAK